ncbi:MAG TPA: glycine--tRNA ligase subunit beta [Candidatus Polarisedimenticolaceae bacterium]|nr:glycine--tRNA ligase subunit beta [Candidatus Polarisedimenticolaceae bacterium]
MNAPLLLEIGCEEIPARMIGGAAADLAARVTEVLESAGLTHGGAVGWGGSRRLAVRVEGVPERQPDRDEQVLGPPVKAAFAADGAPTQALLGFARKQGIDVALLAPVETERGTYAGFRRSVSGKPLEEVLQDAFPRVVEGMSFPKTMRWAEGKHRWVRPVHWLLALHGARPLALSLFGVAAEPASRGHRFLAAGPVPVPAPDDYAPALARACVVVETEERRRRIESLLHAAAAAEGGTLVADPPLLDEVADLVEWPGVVVGRFDASFLELPREILVTTLRHHQKAFSVARDGRLLPLFLSVANTDRDPRGHVRRGNEWVVSGRLTDARFFWEEDRARTLRARLPELERVQFHKEAGSYARKAERVAGIAGTLASLLAEEGVAIASAAEVKDAAALAKADLVTSLVGEFPELQGIVGGLLLSAEGGGERVAAAVAEHYRPAGQGDRIPETPLGCLLSVADKLDTIHVLLRAGERPSGSKDPFGLRRAVNAVCRVLLESRWPLSLRALWAAAGEDAATWIFLEERLGLFFLDRGFSGPEVRAVLRAAGGAAALQAPLADLEARLQAVREQRESAELLRMAELTKRIANIGPQAARMIAAWSGFRPAASWVDPVPAGAALQEEVRSASADVAELRQRGEYRALVARLSSLAAPVARFFEDVLVLDPEDRDATHHRAALLEELRALLTSSFDLTQLGGEAPASH